MKSQMRGPARTSPLGGRDLKLPRRRRPWPGWVKGLLWSAGMLMLATCFHLDHLGR